MKKNSVYVVLVLTFIVLFTSICYATEERGTSRGSRDPRTTTSDSEPIASGRVSDARGGKAQYLDPSELGGDLRTEISLVEFENFQFPNAGQDFNAQDVKLKSGFPGTIEFAQFIMYKKTIAGRADKGDETSLYIRVQLNEGYKYAENPDAKLNGMTEDVRIHNDSFGDRLYGFVFYYTVGETTTIKITDQSPATIEFHEGEDVKLFVKATGTESYQWNKYSTSSGGVKQVYRPSKINGATESEYVITKADKTLDGAEYNCTLTCQDGEVTTSTFKLKLVESVVEEQKTEVKYKVEFNSNGGSKIATQEVTEKGKAVEPKDPKQEGYTFEGWYIDKKLTKAYDFNQAVTADLLLYAKWTEVEKEEKKPWSKASDWAVAELDKANSNNLIPTIFNEQDLTKNITRKEFAYVVVKLYERVSKIKAIKPATNPFTDTKDEEVLKAFNVGITNGTSDTTFDPDALITREQMATMMTRALTKAGIDTSVNLEKISKFADDSEMHDWGKTAIYYMSNIEIIKGMGDNQFGVLGNATREQALLISERSVEKFVK